MLIVVINLGYGFLDCPLFYREKRIWFLSVLDFNLLIWNVYEAGNKLIC